MVAIMPQVLVAKPTPEFPLRYGLLQAAVGPLTLETHMRGGGVKYMETMCGGGQGYEINCLTDLDTKVFNEAGIDVVTGVSFNIISNYICSPVGLSIGELNAFALQKFHSVEQSVLEQIFSTSGFGMSPGLSGNADVVDLSGSGTTDAVNVISLLEDAIYCTSQYGAPAYLHMPIPVFNALKREHLIEFDGMRWRTPMGSVVVGGCYAGDDPDGVDPAAGTFWVYATGQTTVWRTANGAEEVIPVQGALDRVTNQWNGVVEREYAVTFECAIYAAPVTLWEVAP